MSIICYDDIVTQKLRKWVPEAAKLRVLHPDETKRLFERTAEDNNDEPIALPLISISRKDDIELLTSVKQPKSFDGLRLVPEGLTTDLSNLRGDDYRKAIEKLPGGTFQFNVIPIRLEYQLDIFAKRQDECLEYVRSFLFKLVNNPLLKIEIPYHNLNIEHSANIRVQSNIADTSSISERLFPGQFSRWTIRFEIQDAFLFSIPYRANWKLIADDGDVPDDSLLSVLELSDNISADGEQERLDIRFIK